jgi:FkbM family methyltransferase
MKHLPHPLRAILRAIAWNAVSLHSVTASGMQLRIANPSDWLVFNEIFVKGEYDRAIRIALENASDQINVLDLGANVGFFSFRVLDLLRVSGRSDVKPNIIAIEGSPTCYRQLTARMGEGRVNGDVTCLLGLVGHRDGETVIHENAFAARSSIVRNEVGSSRKVPFVDLNSIIAPGTSIDLLKCDIEGAEELFIGNYPDLLRQTRVVVVEFHHDLCDTDRCISLLGKAGFSTLESSHATSTTLTTFVRSPITEPATDTSSYKRLLT